MLALVDFSIAVLVLAAAYFLVMLGVKLFKSLNSSDNNNGPKN